jgi:hypothetical protein
MVGNVTKENLQSKLKTSNDDELATLHRFIAKQKGLADRLFKARWITSKQKDEINFVAENLPKYGGKRRCSTRSKKYNKSNKRSKRTRTLRRKRYSRKS